jgi:hypothetical protein
MVPFKVPSDALERRNHLANRDRQNQAQKRRFPPAGPDEVAK